MPLHTDKEKLLRPPTDEERDLAAALRAVGDINRFRIFLIVMEEPLISVSAIAQILGLSAPLASQHIKTLTGVRLLTKCRSGKLVYLQLDLSNPLVEELIRWIRRASKKRPVKKRKSGTRKVSP